MTKETEKEIFEAEMEVADMVEVEKDHQAWLQREREEASLMRNSRRWD